MGFPLARGVGVCAVILAAMTTLAPIGAHAQTTGTLRGFVRDSDGLDVPGAKVRLVGAALIGGEQLRVSDDLGAFVFSDLPPGAYDLSVSHAALGDWQATGLRVASAGEVSIVAVLNGTSISVVGRRSVVDPTDTGIGETFTREQLQKLPIGRSESAAPALTPGMGAGGNPRAAGAAPNESTRMVDGVNVTDPVTNTFGQNFAFDAIDELRVQLGGFMPEHGQALGSLIEIVTASGGNNLEFDVGGYVVDGRWRTRRDARYTADGLQLAPTDFDSRFRSLQLAGRVTGPILKDRAWFAVNYQHSRTLIANVGVPLPRDFDGQHVFAKLTVQPSGAHRLTASLSSSPAAIDNTLQGSPFVKPEAQGRQFQTGFVAMGRWQWFPRTDVSVDTQAVAQRIGLEIGPVPCTHETSRGVHPCKPGEEEGHEDWTTPGRVGQFGAFNSVNFGQFAFDDRMRYHLSSKVTMLQLGGRRGGTHDVKVGAEVVATTWDQIQGRAGNVLYGDINVTGWDPTTFGNWYRWELSGPIAFRTGGTQVAAFAQDSWRIRENLVLKGGLRFDGASLRNDVGEVVVAQRAFGPRLYAAWDPTKDGRTKVVGGYGRFYDTGRLAVASFTSRAATGGKLWLGDAVGGDLASNQDSMFLVQPRENPSIAHDRLRAPRVDDLTLQVERAVLDDVGVGVQTQYKRTTHLFEFDERNLVYDQDGSSVLGARSGDTQVPNYRMRTPKLASRDYLMVNTQLTKVSSKRWFATVNYTWSLSWGTSPQSLSGSFANAPQTGFARGPLVGTDIRHAVKAYGAWDLPLDPFTPSIGFSLTYASGQPIERLYPTDEPAPGGSWGLRIRDRGRYTRTPDVWDLGLRLTQAVQLKQGRLELDVQLLNALNNRSAVAFLPTLDTDNRLMAAARQDPLRVQLGARVLY
jgi:hypothetical protein